MKIIKLRQQTAVERQGKYGWETDTVFEPVFLSSNHIESMSPAGLTYIRMVSGERITVKETPEEIIALINGENDESLKVWEKLGEKS
ncbi:flagellar FlbD family protein [Escherichia coli]|uniref:flagellar FlbD family protein n=1 Tax=Escherichia coli TaxID=562 RepID=UPI00374DC743